MTGRSPLKYAGYSIVMQEVPDEISLAFNISGCPHRCEGCHSEFLWNDIGDGLLENMDHLLDIYGDHITCVCFMGGEQNTDELLTALWRVRARGLKTCVYAGCDTVDNLQDILPFVTYLKLGHYDREKGGLDSPSTNQRMYYINDGPMPMWRPKTSPPVTANSASGKRSATTA